jgi:hypothetical protein
MKNLNLKKATYKDIEKFFLNALLSNTEDGINCETGEIGLLMFNLLVEKWANERGIKKESEILNITTNTEKIQYIKYFLANGKILLITHNPKLDLVEGQKIDDTTGFPSRSSVLYLKKIV